MTFILVATIFCFGNKCGSFFCWGEVTGNSFICWSLAKVGRVVGITFIWDYQERVRDKDLVTVFMLRRPLLTPPSRGRWALSSTAWRGRRVRPRSLRALYRRLEPFTRCVRTLARLRRLWSAAWNFQYNWRAVLTRGAGGCSGFWQFQPYVYSDVR